MIFHDLGIEIVSFPKNGGSFHSLLYYQRVLKKYMNSSLGNNGIPKIFILYRYVDIWLSQVRFFFSGEDMFQKYETKQVHPWRRNWFYP